jgi:hypothetical protein
MPSFNSSSLAISVGLFVMGLVMSTTIVVGFLVALPPAYFLDPQSPQPRSAGRLLLLTAKNILAVLLIAFGIVLAIPGVPGQGLLTILVGLLLLGGRGQRTTARRLLRRPFVKGRVDGLRRRFGRSPLLLGEADSSPAAPTRR